MPKLPHEPKYTTGDVVYFPFTKEDSFRLACPDCNDTRTWQAISPAGIGYTIPCPRCTMYNQLPKELSLKGVRYVGDVRKLTIGAVRYNSHPTFEGDEHFEYMCLETGIGSGSIYKQSLLHDNPESARLVADIRAAEQNAKKSKTQALQMPWLRTLDINTYEISRATTSLMEDKMYVVKRAVDSLRETVCEAFAEYQADPKNVSHEGLLEELKKWFFRVGFPLEAYDDTIEPYKCSINLYTTPDMKWQD